MPLAGLHDSLDPWQRIQIKEEAEVIFFQTRAFQLLL